MEDHNEIQKARALIARDMEWDNEEEIKTEAELIRLLSQHIAWLIDRRTEHLFSLMYRLDIPEEKVRAALLPGNDEAPAHALARLVVERQKQRLATRRQYPPEKLDDDWW